LTLVAVSVELPIVGLLAFWLTDWDVSSPCRSVCPVVPMITPGPSPTICVLPSSDASVSLATLLPVSV
jgi:hypothetical protein